ncbi:MAG: M1 family aminopeptidase [Acidobacteria bacterium]|nr:M1 family aminopeptidase [Acidobacteriota bacterium]
MRVAAFGSAFVLTLPLVLVAQPVGSSAPAPITQQLREVELDPTQCYRVRDFQFSREEARFYLNEGVLTFLKPVQGRVMGAVFSADVEGGDGELLLIPPSRAERQSLANFTKSPTLSEHFKTALFLFSDGAGNELLESLRQAGAAQPPREEALLQASRWTPVVRNVLTSFELRLARDLLSDGPLTNGMFFAAVSGTQLGNFDVYYDPRSRQQLTVGQIVTRNERTFFDVWTHFQTRNFREGRRSQPPLEYRITDARLDARLDANLHLAVTSELKVALDRPASALPFEISPRMKVTAANVDGVPVEVLRRDAVRSNLMRGDQNDSFLLVLAAPLAAGDHTVTIQHEGDVISNAGNKVFFVGARGNWYPSHGLQFARYDITFRYPRRLNLVASGALIDEKVEGEERITHRKSTVPLRFVGFNLGDYAKVTASRGGYEVVVYANRQLEPALERPATATTMPMPSPFPRRRADVPAPLLMSPNPLARVEQIASSMAQDYEWMAQRLGPPPLTSLSVSPIPGNFGQGFPGLIYLSTLAYLDSPSQLIQNRESLLYFAELLETHETAHQWWGNSVTSASYDDEWLQEALANYMSLLALEKRHGVKAMDTILGEYRNRLIAKDPDGHEIESAGPVTFGLRLNSSQSPYAWRTIIYEKGTWIIHMLRRRLGDDLFWALLAETARKYRLQSLSTAEFRDLAATFLAQQPARDSYRAIDPKLEGFFDTWASGTGVPGLKLSWTTKGVAPKVTLTATITQTGVPEDFTDAVPVEIQFAKGKPITRWVRLSSEPAALTMTLPTVPAKVVLDPAGATLKR